MNQTVGAHRERERETERCFDGPQTQTQTQHHGGTQNQGTTVYLGPPPPPSEHETLKEYYNLIVWYSRDCEPLKHQCLRPVTFFSFSLSSFSHFIELTRFGRFR